MAKPEWKEYQPGTFELCLGGKILKIGKNGQGDVALGPFGGSVDLPDVSVEEKQKLLLIDGYQGLLRDIEAFEQGMIASGLNPSDYSSK